MRIKILSKLAAIVTDKLHVCIYRTKRRFNRSCITKARSFYGLNTGLNFTHSLTYYAAAVQCNNVRQRNSLGRPLDTKAIQHTSKLLTCRIVG